MLGWFYFTLPSEEQLTEQQRQRVIRDSLAQVELNQNLNPNLDSDIGVPSRMQNQGIRANARNNMESSQIIDSDEPKVQKVGMFGAIQDSVQRFITIDTPLYKAIFTNKGAGPTQFTLKKHVNWAGTPVQMIGDTTLSAYNLGFLSTENYNVETQRILFEAENLASNILVLTGESRSLSYRLNVPNGGALRYTYTFFSDSYEINLRVEYIGIQEYILGRSVDFGFTSPLNFTERDKVQEALATSAYLYAGGELERLKVDNPDENNGYNELNINGMVEWVATKTKFFAQLIQPIHNTEGALLVGQINGKVDQPTTDHAYQAMVNSDIPTNGTQEYQLYIGPTKYADMKSFNEHAFDMVEVGYGWLRWFSDPFVRFIVIPFFNIMGGFISNYGVLVIIFAITVKLVLSPLTFKSYKSMAAMKELQPQMKDLQEKYKSDPQKQQKATMDLYRKNKVNPLGGCLPMLLQFPILITLWLFFQNSILLRQESFLWANDLSAPDFIINLPFGIPFLGDQIGGFVILMSLSMGLQSRLTGGASGGGAASGVMAQNMKIMQYILPIMMLFIFNRFASGLSLYYLIFNVLSIVQQYYINRSTRKTALAKS
tara:strand:+ start:21934 stop:23733 length:1800 start_codon:yes stop_codon:yes gene_type:complete